MRSGQLGAWPGGTRSEAGRGGTRSEAAAGAAGQARQADATRWPRVRAWAPRRGSDGAHLRKGHVPACWGGCGGEGACCCSVGSGGGSCATSPRAGPAAGAGLGWWDAALRGRRRVVRPPRCWRRPHLWARLLARPRGAGEAAGGRPWPRVCGGADVGPAWRDGRVGCSMTCACPSICLPSCLHQLSSDYMAGADDGCSITITIDAKPRLRTLQPGAFGCLEAHRL